MALVKSNIAFELVNWIHFFLSKHKTNSFEADEIKAIIQ